VLADNIASDCEKDELWIDVDYHPCTILQKAAAAAGFNPDFQFPVKTSMWVGGGQVSVKEGYGAPNRIIYTTPVDLPPDSE
jgi:hypothetical protein